LLAIDYVACFVERIAHGIIDQVFIGWMGTLVTNHRRLLPSSRGSGLKPNEGIGAFECCNMEVWPLPEHPSQTMLDPGTRFAIETNFIGINCA
jgi:hypothetical protein